MSLLLAESYGSQGAWTPYTPRLLSVGLVTPGVNPADPEMGETVATGAFSRFGRMVAGRFQFRMGDGFGASSERGAYGVELPIPPFFVDNEDDQMTTPQLAGFGWAIDNTKDGLYHLFNMVYDPPWSAGNLGQSMAIMFVDEGRFSGNPPGNPLGMFGNPTPVGVPFEFTEGDVLAGQFLYQVKRD